MRKLITLALVPALVLSTAGVVQAQENDVATSQYVTEYTEEDNGSSSSDTDTNNGSSSSEDTDNGYSDNGSSSSDTDNGSSSSEDTDNGSSDNGVGVGVGVFFGMIGGAALLGFIIGKILQSVGVQPFL